MILKLYQLIEFPTFFEKIKNQNLSFKVSYKLTMLAQEVEKHLNFYQEKMRKLLLQYGEKDENGDLIPTEDGQGIKLIQETMQEAYEKVAELRNLDIELPEYKFNLEAFENTELTLMEMNVILPFIEE